MLAHAASAQGISAVENMCGRPHVLNHLSIPAACFTHPEVRFSCRSAPLFVGVSLRGSAAEALISYQRLDRPRGRIGPFLLQTCRAARHNLKAGLVWSEYHCLTRHVLHCSSSNRHSDANPKLCICKVDELHIVQTQLCQKA